MRRFLAVAEADGYSPVWLLALHTGMRRGELLGLRWTDVDLTKGVLHVRQAVTVHHHAAYISEPKTASGRRTIALDAPCVAALWEHRARQNARRLALGAAWQEYDLVFASRRRHAHRPQQPVPPLCRARGESRRAPHPVSWPPAQPCHAADEAGRPPQGGEREIGPCRYQHHLQTYSHVLPAMQREAADIFAAAIAEGQ
jgi:hypothetical protein